MIPNFAMKMRGREMGDGTLVMKRGGNALKFEHKSQPGQELVLYTLAFNH